MVYAANLGNTFVAKILLANKANPDTKTKVLLSMLNVANVQ